MIGAGSRSRLASASSSSPVRREKRVRPDERVALMGCPWPASRAKRARLHERTAVLTMPGAVQPGWALRQPLGGRHSACAALQVVMAVRWGCPSEGWRIGPALREAFRVGEACLQWEGSKGRMEDVAAVSGKMDGRPSVQVSGGEATEQHDSDWVRRRRDLWLNILSKLCPRSLETMNGRRLAVTVRRPATRFRWPKQGRLPCLGRDGSQNRNPLAAPAPQIIGGRRPMVLAMGRRPRSHAAQLEKQAHDGVSLLSRRRRAPSRRAWGEGDGGVAPSD